MIGELQASNIYTTTESYEKYALITSLSDYYTTTESDDKFISIDTIQSRSLTTLKSTNGYFDNLYIFQQLPQGAIQ